MNRKTIALLHHPVVDKNQQLYTTAITNIDVHDIARASCTYGLDQYFLVSPIAAQQAMARHIADFWVDGNGHRKNADRARALSLISVQPDLAGAIEHETSVTGKRPLLISTSAKPCGEKTISYAQGREIMNESPSSILIFGTGYGLAPSVIEASDYVLEPIYGPTDYNHLSVRSAASIILDRLFSIAQ